MEHIKRFNTQDEFLVEKPTLAYPCVSYVKEKDNVIYNKLDYSLSTFKITQEVIDRYDGSMTELPIYVNYEGAVDSYIIDEYILEHEYDIKRGNDIELELMLVNSVNSYLYVPTLESTINNNDLSTDIVFKTDSEVSENDCILLSLFMNGSLLECQPFIITEARDLLVFSEDLKSFSLTQEMCDNLKPVPGVSVGCVYIDIASLEKIIIGESDTADFPSFVTYTEQRTIINSSKIMIDTNVYGSFENSSSPSAITIPFTQEKLDHYFDVKINYGESCNNIGFFTLSLCKIDLSNLSKKKKYEIKNGHFSGMTYLTSVIIGDSITKIPNFAFNGCSNLTSITFGNNVEAIYPHAFTSCGLKEIVIPDSVTSIGSYAFGDCVGLTNLYIPSSVNNISGNIVNGCVNINNIVVSENNTTYDSRENCNAIIETATNKLVIGCKNTIIPDSVTIISYEAFYSCSGLKEIIIPDSVTSIGADAFYNCNLKSITIPASVTSIGMRAFGSNYDLNSITFKSYEIPGFHNKMIGSMYSQTTDPYNTFVDISSTGTIYYPFKNEGYGQTIYDLENWEKIPIFDENIQPDVIATYTVTDTTSSIKLFYSKPSAMKINGELVMKPINNYYYTFNDVGEYTIEYYYNTYSIPSDAFEGCSGLTSVIIGSGVKSIGNRAFGYCSGLTSITIGDSVTSIGNSAFKNCSGLTSVTIPDSVTSIGDIAFSNCSGLTSVTIGSGVTSIGNSAFTYCDNLTEIVIPNSVTSIGNGAFINCFILSSITSYAIKAPNIYKETFENIKYNGVLKYPQGSDYSSWMNTEQYYLGYYNWTSQEIEVQTEETME